MQQLYLPRLSPVHSLDARVRVLLTLAFILVLSLVPAGSWTVYILCYALLLSAALVARIDPRLLHLRALLALPFVLAALPLLFSGPPPLPIVALPAGCVLPLSLPGLERFAAIAAHSWSPSRPPCCLRPPPLSTRSSSPCALAPTPSPGRRHRADVAVSLRIGG